MGAPKRKKPAIVSILLFFLAGILMIYFLYGSSWIKRMRYPLKFEEEIKEYSAEYSVSRFLSDAVSGRDARGLMQLLPSTATWAAGKMGLADFEEAKLLDPEVNIRIGCWYLGFLSSRFPGSDELILAAYNGGIGNVQKWLQDKTYSGDGQQLDHIPFQETRNYITKVQDAYEIYKEIYPSLDLSPNQKGSY